jgi:hypothetical protein
MTLFKFGTPIHRAHSVFGESKVLELLIPHSEIYGRLLM